MYICLSCLHNPSQVHAKELKLDLMGMAPSSRTWWMMSNRELLGSNFIKHHNTNISTPCSTSITLQLLDELVQHRLFPKKILIEMQENTCIFIHSWGIPDLSHSFILSASPPAIVWVEQRTPSNEASESSFRGAAICQVGRIGKANVVQLMSCWILLNLFEN